MGTVSINHQSHMENSDNISLAWNIAVENAKSIHPSF